VMWLVLVVQAYWLLGTAFIGALLVLPKLLPAVAWAHAVSRNLRHHGKSRGQREPLSVPKG